MASGVTSLSLVRDELFATMEEAESSLEQFIAERMNGSLLQQAVENLQQVRGTLKLIELTGAELLAQEVLDQATDIPTGAGEERDAQLSALSNALHVLRRYLESMDTHRQEIPELLLPAINDLRRSGGQPALAESFFFSVRLDMPRPHAPTQALDAAAKEALGRKMRRAYQVGLLGFIKQQATKASLTLMCKAMSRIDQLFANESRGRLCWVASAALEAQLDGDMLVRNSRKQLFSRLDRELKKLLNSADYEPPRSLLKELLYVVALSDSSGPLVTSIRSVFRLPSLPFTDQLLEQEYLRLAGPGQAVIRSLTSAIREELSSVKDSLDLIERGTLDEENLSNLYALIGKLGKTLGMVGLSSSGHALAEHLPVVANWVSGNAPQPGELNKIADSVLFVEGMVASLSSGSSKRSQRKTPAAEVSEVDMFALLQLNEARIVVIDEAKTSIALTKRSVTAYLESNGERSHLANVPFSLQAVRGGLWFLGQERAAALVGACADYIQEQMLDISQIPSEQTLESLADALASLEYYLDTEQSAQNSDGTSVLDMASESIRALGVQVAA
ncbi:ferrous iron transporter B [Pseudomonas sp. MS19]|uniref:ferrous iron transporter B n=1 Tax=Pseudomonas sp. MS19 TaxID=2579939 RepID=UPI00156227E7|nr:ferrous iron transporter B [Pseudomonas sp. MS19]NRH29760.1 ferrous iron transporter B [Pseudomonas sp. MS19]